MKSLIVLQRHVDHTYTWFEVNVDGSIECEQQYHAIDELPNEEQPLPVTLLLPGDQATSTTVNIPRLNANELKQALPFALEEQLIGDVGSFICCPGDYNPNNNLNVIVMQREGFESLLNALNQRFTVAAACPDYLTMPYHDSRWTVASFQSLSKANRQPIGYPLLSSVSTFESRGLTALV